MQLSLDSPRLTGIFTFTLNTLNEHLTRTRRGTINLQNNGAFFTYRNTVKNNHKHF